MTQDYDWQKEAFDKWVENGRKGVIKAVPGAGKTRAGVRILQAVRDENSGIRIAILCPTMEIMKQWGDACSEIGLEEDDETFFIRTYFWGSKLSEINHEAFDLVVYDECHSLKSDVRAKAFNIKKKSWLGLSATPGGIEDILGGVFLEVDWDDANIAPFKIKYVVFPMSGMEQMAYRRMTTEVKNAFADREEGRIREDQLMAAIMKRRSFVYTLPERIEIALQLVEEHPTDRIIIFAERLEQVNLISAELFARGVANAIYTSETDTLDLYKDKQVRVLVTSKMVKEGFNDPSTTIGILASTPLTERNQVQTVGRIIRFFPEKVAEIFIVLAGGTTDTKLLKEGMDGFQINYHPNDGISPSLDYLEMLLAKGVKRYGRGSA